MLILGIDEAGRGPVIGPMIICGYLIDNRNIKKLQKLNVKDSKELSKNQREELYDKLIKLAENVKFSVVSAKKIDELREISNLNKHELEEISKIVNQLKPHVTIIDAFEKNLELFELKIKSKLKVNTKLICEHKADKRYPVVSAASILAKVERDRAIEELNKRFDLGSGYPSDEKTITFLERCLKDFGYFPSFVRKSWITVKNLVKKKQKTIFEFAKI